MVEVLDHLLLFFPFMNLNEPDRISSEFKMHRNLLGPRKHKLRRNPKCMKNGCIYDDILESDGNNVESLKKRF